MSNYLLLRSNKQSGPYTLDQIRSLGLKAYDLIWVEGRSAAWRYPGEVEEFKSFAPMVEEQPYDRFYKRNPVKNQEPAIETQTLTHSSVLGNSTFTEQNKTQIYAAHPVLDKAMPLKEPLLQPGPAARTLEIKDPSAGKKTMSFIPSDRSSESVALEEKFSQPLD